MPQHFPQEAYNLLVEQVHAPVFFQKLARDYNVVPRSQQEQLELLELAGLLQNAQNEQATKEAASGGGLITQAVDGLKTHLGRQGSFVAPTSQERLVKAAAAEAVQNPGLRQAALQYVDYLASLAG